MFGLRAEAAGFLLGVNGNLLHPATIEDSHQSAVPSHPDTTPNIFRRYRVVGIVHFDVPVTMHRPLSFMEEREPTGWQRQQCRTLDLPKDFANLLTRRAVDACIGDVGLPVQQVAILGGQTGESPALQCVAFNIADPSLDLALVAGRVRLGRQDHGPIHNACRTIG